MDDGEYKNDAIDNMIKAAAIGMTHEQRQACFYAQQGLRALLSEWNATSHDVKIGAIKDAVAAFGYVPLPDDLADEDVSSKTASIDTGGSQ